MLDKNSLKICCTGWPPDSFQALQSETVETVLDRLGGAGAAVPLLGGLAKDSTHSRSTAERPLLRLALLLSATGHCACAGMAVASSASTANSWQSPEEVPAQRNQTEAGGHNVQTMDPSTRT